MFSKLLVLLTVSSAALATVFVTAPVASTTFTGGQPATIRWQDSGVAPSLKDFGPAKISIYAGNAQQQTSLQLLKDNVDVSTTSELTFTVDASIGPNSKEYFIRFESLGLKDAAQPQFPALAFSAKFALEKMTGVFTADVLSQIAGQSTAPLATAASTPAASSPATPASVTPSSKPTVAGSSTPAASSAKPSSPASATPTSGALMTRAGWAGALFGAVVGAAMF
ncbi:hypothetical protein D9619_009578 [Psilocybe cf. subviscida]|uniref:Yeast cell wall synthesis Kre9/Knh1-like N-terminal domain-containing protein n=1 Tax=Psilocybe cf. subviscida TaxID=2480587 RepID=A0A8H5F662_9AGAR|nr:hypothetical protein D9619_009578 [Psilocybe cf. subviscida]